MKQRVKVRFTYDGWVDVEAATKKEAVEIASEWFWATAGAFGTGNEELIKDWEFPINPEMKVEDE